MNLEQFFNKLDRLGEHIPLMSLKEMLKELTVADHEIAEFGSFHTDRYQRNRLRRSDHYEALFLCFEAGQRTPIHDHAGSACGVKVLMGVGTETVFARTEDGWLYATGSRQLPTGGVVGSNDMDTHQLSNLQPHGGRLVTLHIYSPPLGEVGNYSLDDNGAIHVRATVNERPFRAMHEPSTGHRSCGECDGSGRCGTE
ncbi:MAG TPA: cysteine dioxygenase family protein, partial [Pirellulaceae bacterium]|nr:cysteine dioxygenase family protein [Pirellulaceae bacterium]